MTRNRFKTFGRAALAAIVVTACAEQRAVIEPLSDVPAFAKAGGGKKLKVAKKLKVGAPALASAVIGKSGGTIKAGDCTLEIAAGSLSKPTEITVVDPGLVYAACQLLPAGMKYNTGAFVRLHMNMGANQPEGVGGAYLGEDFGAIDAGGNATARETYGAVQNNGVSTFRVYHHSAYTTVCGDNGECYCMM